jgi:eukaryotic-like serine/threonine-protein kinase
MFRRRRRVAETEETAPQPQGRYVREEVETPPPRRPLLWPWLLLLLLLVGVGLAGAYLLTRDEDAGGSENRVPNVVGETVTDAVRELGQRGYPADVRGQISRTQVGRVLAQEPDPGEELDRGERVVLVVARSPLTVEVPRVVGSPVGDAFERLQASRLRGREIKVAINKPKGIVVKQQPIAGAGVRRGSLVVLSVSKGPRIVTVPLVEGLKQQAVLARLKRALLDAKVVNVPAREPAGTVIAQSPKAGTRVPSGSAVQINVAAVPGSTDTTPTTGTATVPNVVGTRDTEAVARIEQAVSACSRLPSPRASPRGPCSRSLRPEAPWPGAARP